MRKLLMLCVIAVAAVVAVVPAAATHPAANGRIAFDRGDPVLQDDVVYTVNPDGSGLRRLLDHAEQPHWAPDGVHLIAFPHDADDVEGRIVDTRTGTYRDLPATDPSVFIPCGVWSPDGGRLACSGYSDVPERNGIYLVSSLDGHVIHQVTTNTMTEDDPGSFSPTGARLVFMRAGFDGPDTLDVVQLWGSNRVDQITPPGLFIAGFSGDWSPHGNEIIFGAKWPDAPRFSIYAVHSDGSGLREIPIADCGTAAAGCFQPRWSPDGTKIVFTRFSPASGRSIYTVDAAGGQPTPVTSGDGSDAVPDWGAAPGSSQFR
jgi:Tol biopolymer transport system component